MGTVMIVANISIVVLVFLALSLFINPGFYQDMIKEYGKSKTLVFFSGVVNLVVATAILGSFREWHADWTVLVTIIGWSALLKGGLLIIFPARMMSHIKSMKMKRSLIYVYGLVCAALAICLIRGVYGG